MIDLATAARFEVTDRLNRYPRAIRDGKIAADAAIDDTEVWDAIASAFETGAPIKSMLVSPRYRQGISWRDVTAALDRAITNRSAACTYGPDDSALAQRRDAVLAIAAHVRPHADWFIDLTEELRGRAAPQAKAA